MKAYLFDLDGTLLNTINSIAYFANKALNKYGFHSIPTERYKHLVGDGTRILVQRMLKEVGADEKMFEPVYNEYTKAYGDDYLYLTHPYDGIIELLKELKSAGCKTAVMTNKNHDVSQKIIDELFGDLIDVCFGKKDGYQPKPDPASTNELIRLLGVDKKDCIYIGDTIVDMKTGSNAGLYTIGVLWGFRDIDELRSGMPQMIVEHPSEILKTLE